MLNRHAPLIRVMTFMGQASAGKGVKGFTQNEQLEVKTAFVFIQSICTTVGAKDLHHGHDCHCNIGLLLLLFFQSRMIIHDWKKQV